MKLIKLYWKDSEGQSVMVDDEDYDYLNKWRWGLSDGYAVRVGYKIDENDEIRRKTIRMHRVIMGITESDIWVDHIDRNGLNNQKSNLRIATRSQNMQNKGPAKTNAKSDIGRTSKYKGVSYMKSIRRGKEYRYWVVQCRGNGKRYKKNCNSEIEAAIQYNEWAKEMHGEYAYQNIIQ